ncbi:MAG: hypothetical protein HUU35_03935 [Armatimonadetes bacterium]|nr:hypothetical protein [Armatimonadota bacterium]
MRAHCLLMALVAVAVGAAQTERVSVRGGDTCVVFDPAAKGAIASLTDLITERELALPGRLFQLDVSERDQPQKRFSLTQREAATVEVVAREQGAELRFGDLGGRGVGVVCRVIGGDPWLRWRLAVQLPPSLTLEMVRFPILAMPTAAGDAYVAGATKGGVFHNLGAMKSGASLGFSQPGALAAQFACYYHPEGGLVAAALDPQGYPKGVAANRTDDGVELLWTRPCYATGSLDLGYDIGLATFRGDWREAADRYRAWAVAQPWCARPLAARDDLPGWLRAGPATVRFNRSWLAQPERVARWLNDYWKPHFGPDTPLVAAFWGWEKVDTWVTPDYFPVYPSDEAFVALQQQARSLGAHSFFWPSGYHYTLTFGKRPDGSFLWDDRARFDREARAHAVVTRDGQALNGDRSWLQGGQTSTLCPGDPWTIDWFTRLGAEIARRGVEMVQVDQVVGAGFPACYSTKHGHPPGPGLWMTEAFHRQLAALNAACRAIEPDAVICFEEPNEHFIHEVGIQDYRDWETIKRGGVELASVFNYVYHDYLPTFQSNPQAGNLLQAAYCLANGQMPHFVPRAVFGPGPLLLNGGFEEGARLPDAWDKVGGYQGQLWTGEAELDREARHDGGRALRLANNEPKEVVQVSQNVAVGGDFRIGGTYRLSAWLRSEGLAEPNAISLATFAPGLKSTGGSRIEIPRQGGQWVHGAAEFTVPPGSEMLRIMIHLAGPGTVWVDDIRLEQVTGGRATEVARPAVPLDHELMRQWVSLYHGEGRPFLFLGQMLPPPRLETASITYENRPFAAVLHNAWRAPDGQEAVVLVNATPAAREAILHWRGQPRRLRFEPYQVRLVR